MCVSECVKGVKCENVKSGVEMENSMNTHWVFINIWFVKVTLRFQPDSTFLPVSRESNLLDFLFRTRSGADAMSSLAASIDFIAGIPMAADG